MDNTLKVSGTAKKEVKSDWVIIDIKIISENDNYQVALEDANGRYNLLLEKLEQFRIAKVETNNFTVERKYRAVDNYSTFDKYRICYYLKLEFALDNQMLSNILQAIAIDEIIPEISLSFSLLDPLLYQGELIKLAIEDAKRVGKILTQNNFKDAKLIGVEYVQSPTIMPLSHSFSNYNFAAINPRKIILQETIMLRWHLF